MWTLNELGPWLIVEARVEAIPAWISSLGCSLLTYQCDKLLLAVNWKRRNHRRLQSRVGTRAKLGYAAFDAQLRKRIVTTLYAIRTSVCA